MKKRGRTFRRRVDPLAAFRSASRQHALDASQKLQLGLALRVHMQALATGKADAMAFHHLANAVNTSMVLSEPVDNADLSSHIGAAQDALLRLKVNGDAGRWLLDGPNLNAIKAWLDLYEQQLAAHSQQEIMDALDEVHRRIARGQVFEIQYKEQAA